MERSKTITIYLYPQLGAQELDDSTFYEGMKAIGKIDRVLHVGYNRSELAHYKESESTRILQIGKATHNMIKQAAHPYNVLSAHIRFAKKIVLTKSSRIYQVPVSRHLLDGMRSYIQVSFQVDFPQAKSFNTKRLSRQPPPRRRMLLRSDLRTL